MRAPVPTSLLLVCALFPAVSCGGGGTGGPDAGPAGGASFRLDWGPVEVAPGEENTQCVVKRLGNETEIQVGKIHNVLEAASHHFIVYRVKDTEERPEPYPCQPFTDTLDPEAGSPLMVTQRAEETLELPEGVAFTLEPNQMVRLELHYINASDETQSAAASSTFTTIAADEFEAEADFLFIGNPDIEIPPMAAHTLGPTYFPLPTELEGSRFFALTGHEHQWGTGVEVATTAGPDGADTMVYAPEPFNWDEPETVFHEPAFEVPSNGGFRFTCQWYNGSNETVDFGESANDEMCFFWAYYYPSQGARVCVHTDQAGGLDLCCPGSSLCSLLEDQL